MKRLLVCLSVVFVLMGCGKKGPTAGQKCLKGDSGACFEVRQKAMKNGDTAAATEAALRGIDAMDKESNMKRY